MSEQRTTLDYENPARTPTPADGSPHSAAALAIGVVFGLPLMMVVGIATGCAGLMVGTSIPLVTSGLLFYPLLAAAALVRRNTRFIGIGLIVSPLVVVFVLSVIPAFLTLI